MAVFPRWADLLGLDAEIVGWDIPLGAAPATYRDALRSLRADESVRGGLVTSHKVAFYEHARDMFDELDEQAETCSEISCITKRGSTLGGLAKDPMISAKLLVEFIGNDYWRETDSEALLLGAGGAGTALSVALLSMTPPPARLTVT